jgi:hypothetical protein
MSEMENIRDAYISAPTLSQFGKVQRYSVCVRIVDGKNLSTEKIMIFFSGQMTQYVNATSEQCGNAQYQPFTELTTMLSQMRGKK